jgi:hypothetical protein
LLVRTLKLWDVWDMGFRISWIGFNGLDRQECLARLHMRETQEIDEAQEEPFSLAQLPNNWIVLFANDFEYVSDKRLAELSTGATVIGCRVHEGVMYSDVALYNAGRKMWSVSHYAGDGALDLKIEGQPPAEVLTLRDTLLEKQRSAGATSEVDHVFDVPVEAAQLVTSYRYDQWKFDWGEPIFHVLKVERSGR